MLSSGASLQQVTYVFVPEAPGPHETHARPCINMPIGKEAVGLI